MAINVKGKGSVAKTPRTLSYADGVLTIKQGGREFWYVVDARLADGGHAHHVRLTKMIGTHDADDVASYDVEVSADTAGKQCNCKGFQFRGHCKHADAVAVLVARGHFRNRP